MDLREPTRSEAGMIAAWERHPDNEPFIVAWDEEQHVAAFGDPDLRYFILDDGGLPVGFVLLAGLAGGNGAVEFRRIVVMEKGRGYGRSAVEAIKQYCFEVLGVHRLWLDVFEENIRAQSLYQSAGFVKEGVLRECVRREDGFHSLVVMSMLDSEHASDLPESVS